MKTTKKPLSVILSLLMIITTLTALPFTAHALDESGECGENVTYTFDYDTGTLTISGEGEMSDYNYTSSPFYDQDIDSIVIETSLPACTQCARVTL